MRFAAVYAVEQPAAVADFQAALGERYVAREPLRADSVAGPGEAPGDSSVWLFEDPDRDWTVSLTSTSLALEAVTYRNFDDFVAELATILEALHEVFEPRQEVRLGIRYVNRIEDDRLAKRGISFFVNEQLTGPVGGSLGGELQDSICEMRFAEKDGHMGIRHGLVESSTYLLDFDRFSEGERDFAPKSIITRIKRYHSLIERLFVWSLSERYLNELKGGSR